MTLDDVIELAKHRPPEIPEGGRPRYGALDVLTKAEVLKNGVALPPLEAPPEVRAIFEAGNTIARSPYKWGGGHGKWQDNGYDCSGSVSYALAAAGLLDAPLASGPLMHWGKPGKGKWITIYSQFADMLAKGETLPNFVRGGYDKDYVQNTAYGAGASPEAIAAADMAKADMKALKPVFVGPIKDNAGNIVVAAGAEHPPYDVWLEQTNYLVEGVIGKV